MFSWRVFALPCLGILWSRDIRCYRQERRRGEEFNAETQRRRDAEEFFLLIQFVDVAQVGLRHQQGRWHRRLLSASLYPCVFALFSPLLIFGNFPTSNVLFILKRLSALIPFRVVRFVPQEGCDFFCDGNFSVVYVSTNCEWNAIYSRRKAATMVLKNTRRLAW